MSMRIDHPIEITPELIVSLNAAVKQPSGAHFALLLSQLSVQAAQPNPVPVEADIPAPEPSAQSDAVNGAQFLDIIQRSHVCLPG